MQIVRRAPGRCSPPGRFHLYRRRVRRVARPSRSPAAVRWVCTGCARARRRDNRGARPPVLQGAVGTREDHHPARVVLLPVHLPAEAADGAGRGGRGAGREVPPPGRARPDACRGVAACRCRGVRSPARGVLSTLRVRGAAAWTQSPLLSTATGVLSTALGVLSTALRVLRVCLALVG